MFFFPSRSRHTRCSRDWSSAVCSSDLFAGEKNLPVLLQAFARLGAPYHLLLIGGRRAARPAANVTVLPYRRDSLEPAPWIASAAALVHAGPQETFRLVILVAIACARPAVA